MNATLKRKASLGWLAALGVSGVLVTSGMTGCSSEGAAPGAEPAPVADAGANVDAANVADAAVQDASAASDAGADADADAVVPFDASSAFAQIDAIIEAARAAKTPTPAVGFALYDKDDHLVYSKAYGAFPTSQRVAVASASKMVSGLVLFSLIGKGVLSLDSTTGDVLGWPSGKDKITLRHLLSFTSGLSPEAACTFSPTTPLTECVDKIRDAALESEMGTTFNYGSTHLHVAARMAEVLTGKKWETLFEENVKSPLALPADVAYFTFPKGATGTINPLIAGGLRASMDEYAKILKVIFHRGVGLGVPDALFTAQGIEPFPTVLVKTSPAKSIGVPFRYGLTAWLECATPATGCNAISSPGTYGFTPWVDRDQGYYAILGMELDEAGAGDFAVPLQQSLKPAILAALGK